MSCCFDTILFDLDNTLLDFNRAERAALTGTLEQLGLEPKEEYLVRYSQINQAQWKLLEQGKVIRNRMKVHRYELLFEEIGADCSAEEAAGIYEARLSRGHYFVDGAPELLERLAGKCRMYLVTNGTGSVQRGRIQSAGIEKYFQGTFISEEVGFNKPAKAYFDRCFQLIPDFDREKTILVGDSLSSDIQGGKNAGVRTVWFNPGHEKNDSGVEPDYEIRDLDEVYDLVNCSDVMAVRKC